MTSDEEHLRRLFHESAPVLPEPPDRLAAVGRRARRTRTAGVAAAVLGVALAVTLPSVLPDAKVNSAARAPTGTTDCFNPEQLDRTAQRVRETASSRFPDSFTDLAMTTDVVRVFRKPSAAFDTWVAQEFPGGCVELADARYSGREVQALRARVDADREYWKARGITLNSVAVDPDGTIRISVDGPDVTTAEQEIPARYHNTRVVIRTRSAAPPGTDAVPPGTPLLPTPK